MILVLGQAAQGKSTLASFCAGISPIPSAWINIGSEDADPVSFFYALAHSLQTALEEIDFGPVLAGPSLVMGRREELPLYREWAQLIWDRVSRPVQVIFDGMDRLPADAPSYRFLRLLIENLPEHIHLLLLSREMPPLDLEDLRMRGEASCITNDELAFTLEETRDYLRRIRELPLSRDQIRRIHEVTEGWIGGIILLCESIESFGQGEDAKDPLEELPDKFRLEIFHYFGKKIFASAAKETQRLLLHTSIFEVVEPALVKDLMGMENAGKVLENLTRKHLFVHAIHDAQKGWLYRYHQLLRDFLQTKYWVEVSDEHRRLTCIRAGALFEERGDIEPAIELYLRAKTYPQAARGIEQIGMDLLRHGRMGDLSRWLRALPEVFVQKNPWLLLYLCMTRRFTGSGENISTLPEVLNTFEREGDLRGQILSLAYLIEALIMRGYFSIPLDTLLDKGEEILHSLTSDQCPFERAVLWFQIGFGHWLCTGKPRKSVLACQHAYLLAKDLGVVPLQISALVHAGGALVACGEIGSALQISLKAEKLLEKYKIPEMRTLYLTCSALTWTLSGDPEGAIERVHRARNLAEEHGLIYLYPATLLYDLVSRPHLGEYAKAEEIGGRLLELSQTMGNRFMHGITLVFLGISSYRKGDFERARDLVQDANGVLSSSESRAECHLGLIRIVLGLVAHHLGDCATGEKDLRWALGRFSQMSSFLFLTEAHLALGLVGRKSEPGEVIEHLRAGFGIAEEKGYKHFSILRSKDVARVCALALELEVEEATEYAEHLLATRFALEAGEELARLVKHPKKKVAVKASAILRRIHRSSAPRLRIETLGDFRVYRGDALVENKDWRGNQPRRLLMALICRGCEQVPHELLTEDLWPEASPNAGKRNFRINLHRLRKALEPSLNERFGSSYVHLKNNLLSLDKEHCRLDVEEWTAQVGEGARREARGDIGGTLRAYRQAEGLYRGDFLAKELYSPWATAKREALRRGYLDLLSKIAQLYEKQGAFRKAVVYNKKLLEKDPTLEAACRSLMRLYANRGMRTEALRIYNECRKALHRHLGVDPDELTTALFKKISTGG